MEKIKLTQYSHGAGCGCKISPKVLDQILQSKAAYTPFVNLLVGNDSRDDAAVYDLANGTALISTTDFFMPIVDDPFTFGKIAGANAISDVYAMGGKPLMALAILGWPVNELAPEVAGQVIEGGKAICSEAGIPLAGGHSIDSPEPIFGLAVNGLVDKDRLKMNNTAKEGNLLLLTKPLGVGILTTAEKKGILKSDHQYLAAKQMMQLNKVGFKLGKVKGVRAMTDVTGFGLLGHLIEMAAGSKLSADIYFNKIPLITKDLITYINKGAVPGGTGRNWESYGEKVANIGDNRKSILADPQTSGGLLIAIDEKSFDEVKTIFEEEGLLEFTTPIGQLQAPREKVVHVN